MILLALCAVARGQGGAVDFDGLNDFAVFADDAILEPTNVTIMAWIKMDGFNAGNNYILQKGTFYSANGQNGYGIATYAFPGDLTNNIRALLYVGTNTAVLAQKSDAVFVGSKYHVCATYDGSALRLYLDGSCVATNAVAGTIDYAGTYQRLHIACHEKENGGEAGFFNGKIHDSRIYSRALSASEIYQVANKETAWMHADDPAPVMRTCAVTNDTGTALTGVARNLGTGADGTYSNAPTVVQPHVQTEKPLTMELP